MHNEVNNITTLAFFAKEVDAFFRVVQNWNRVVYARSDIDSYITISAQNWSDDNKICYITVQCNNTAVLFQVGQLFFEECRIASLR